MSALRRVYSLLPSLLIVIAASGHGYAADSDGADIIPKLSNTVVLDGRLHEPQWRKAARITYHRFARWQPDSDDLPDDEFVLRLFHDGAHLYVALASYDAYVESAALDENADGLYALSLLARDQRVHHYRLRWGTPQGQPAGEMLDIDWSARLRAPYNNADKQGGGYVLEFAIPFSILGWQAGDHVRINALVQDHDNNPGGAYNDVKTRFVRFALGHFDSDDAAGFYSMQLAP